VENFLINIALPKYNFRGREG